MLVYLDVETTGLKKPESRIVEVGCVVMVGRTETASFSTLVNPGAEALAAADPGSWAVNGLNPEMLSDAPCEADATERLISFLGRFWGAQLHAFNVEFDAWFLARPPWNIVPAQWGECVMMAAQEMMRDDGAITRGADGKLKRPSLSRAAAHFKVSQPSAHRALVDARVAAQIHAEILGRRQESLAEDEARGMIEEGY